MDSIADRSQSPLCVGHSFILTAAFCSPPRLLIGPSGIALLPLSRPLKTSEREVDPLCSSLQPQNVAPSVP